MSTQHQEPATIQQYWVVGGKYETLDFQHLVQGTERVFGPFARIEDARDTWRRVTETTRCHAAVRYTIAAEPSRALQ